MRNKIVAGNWKMNKTNGEAKALVSEVLLSLKNIKLKEEVRVVFAPPFLSLKEVNDLCDGNKIHASAQNCHQENSGAYTGEISAQMIKSIGCNHVILGHSERREYFNETNEILKEKVNTALGNDLNIIFCIGEKLDERKSGNYFVVVKKQINEALFHLSTESMLKIVLAYEPVWAIGTGETATSEQAQEMHAFIRDLLKEKYGVKVAECISILYGGSCKPSNAKELFSCKDVDGGLIGGASLKATDFVSIIEAI